MANYNPMTEEKFNHIKILLKGGATQEQAAEIAGVCTATVCRVGKAATWADYQNRGKKAEQKTEQKAPTHEIVVQASHYMNEELRNANETLRLIKNVLTALYEELTGTKGGGD